MSESTKTVTLGQREATVFCVVTQKGKVIHQTIDRRLAEAYIRRYNALVLGIKQEPRQPRKYDPEHQKVVDRLRGIADDSLEVSFDPSTFLEGDEEAKGHLYSAYLHCEHEEDVVVLDDRSPESLEDQLVKELKRVAKIYTDLAEAVRLNATDKPVYLVDIVKDGEVVERAYRTDNKRSAETFVSSFNEGPLKADGPKIEAKLCVEGSPA